MKGVEEGGGGECVEMGDQEGKRELSYLFVIG